MTRTELEGICQQQLALDLGCSPSLLDGTENHVILWQELPGRRKYNSDAPMLELAVWKGKFVAACGEKLLPWAQEHLLMVSPEWLFMPNVFRALEGALSPLGCQLQGALLYALPSVPCAPTQPTGPVQWFEKPELEQFRGDTRWSDAFIFDAYTDNFLAVAALDKHGEPVGMAGASRDGARMWQIGLNVVPECRGQGIGTNLTALLKDEILHRGAVPFCGTAGSHIFSREVQRNAGFRPAFAWLYARPAGTKGR